MRGGPALNVDEDHAADRVDPRVVEGRRRTETNPASPDRRQRAWWRPLLLEVQRTGFDVVPERVRRGFVGHELLDGWELVDGGDGRCAGDVMLEPVDVADAPDLGGEDQTVVLGDRDVLRACRPGLALGCHDDVDRFERGNAEVVAEEAAGPGEGAVDTGGPQRQARHVAAHGAPDLPVTTDQGTESAVAERLDGGVEEQVAHPFSVADVMIGSGDTARVTATPATGRIRFGIQVVAADSRSSLVELARRAEGVGFDTLLVPDHVGLPDPFVTLQAAADATTTLRVGTYVLNNDFHDPVLLARAAATLDVLSDGRFELGLGAGHAQPEYEARGVAFEPAKQRVARLAEAVPLLRRLLDGESVTFEGVYYRLRDAACAPHPRQARVPIVVGGNGAAVLRLAAREADGAGLTGLGRTLADGDRHEADWSAASLERRLQMIGDAAGSRGQPELSALVQVVAVTDNRGDAARRIAERVPGLTAEDALETPFLLLGSVPQMVHQIVAAHQRWGFGYFVTRADSVNVMGDVIAGVHARSDTERP